MRWRRGYARAKHRARGLTHQSTASTLTHRPHSERDPESNGRRGSHMSYTGANGTDLGPRHTGGDSALRHTIPAVTPPPTRHVAPLCFITHLQHEIPLIHSSFLTSRFFSFQRRHHHHPRYTFSLSSNSLSLTLHHVLPQNEGRDSTFSTARVGLDLDRHPVLQAWFIDRCPRG